MDILSIEKVGDLFSSDLTKCKQEYKELAKKYHPDSSFGCEKSFIKLKELYEKAINLIIIGEWEKTNFIKVKKETSGFIQLNYTDSFDFEIGTTYVSAKKVMYLINSDKEKYYKNYLEMVSNIKYRDSKMEDEFSKIIPNIATHFKCKNGKYCIVIEKTDDVYTLREVLNYYCGKIDSKHVSWIISRLQNICCFNYYNNMVHNGISIDNIFISPKNHLVYLFGGWWYCTRNNERMIGTTKDVYSVMSVSTKGKKISNPTTDLESVKMIARELLGNKNCNELKKITGVPIHFLDFVISGSKENPYKEFEKWDKSLDFSYGKRKFVEMNYIKK